MNEISATPASTVVDPADFGRGPQAELRRWKVELALAKSRMKDWRENGKKLYARYRADKASMRKNSYNALYANTEILAPAVYNSLPTPDVRRRFGNADPLGKAVSEVLNRALTFNAETTDFDAEIKADVLDMLVVGSGISRVRYVPDLIQVGDVAQTGIEDNETELDHEAQEGQQNEELAWETAPIEHVKWDRYVHGPGRSFKEIPWWAFEHDFTRDEMVKRFGESVGNSVELNGGVADPEAQRITDDATSSLFKTAKCWEIWDKDTRRVIWISEGYLHGPLKIEPDPLKLENFFPFPMPLRAMADADTFEPTALYEQYREQAEELDRISARINKLVAALKVRAIYDPSLGTQISELFRGDDNDLIPADVQVKQLYEAGGISNAIWFAPIDTIIKVVESLYEQREQCKQVIFELTGIADIMRGASDAAETYGAQALKIAFGMTRLSRMQRDVQRYIRDLLALQAEVICEHFSTDTLRQMTQVQLPTDAQVMPQRTAMMQQAVMAKMAGQQVPPLPPKPITWEDVKKAMEDDAQRTFSVDIETDSTLAAAQQEDAQDLSTVMEAIVSTIQGLWPMVQAQVIPFQAAKELLLMVARKFRCGNAIEDAIDQMQPPAPQQNPQATIPLQIEQMRQQGKQAEIAASVQAKQQEAQIDAQTEAAKQAAQAHQAAQQNALEAQRDQLQQQNQMFLEKLRQENAAQAQMMQMQMQLLIAAMNNRAKVEVAEVTAGAQLAGSQIAAANAASGGNDAAV